MRVKLQLAAVSLLLFSVQASATVQQPGGVAVPVPVPTAELNLVTQSWSWNTLATSYRDPAGNELTTPIAFGEYYSPPAFPQFVDGDAITLQGLFKWRGEAIDWQLDAQSPVGSFVPSCAVTVEPMLMGGNCQSQLVWYNVSNPISAQPPQITEVYELLPADMSTFLDCRDNFGARSTDGFCPLAWDNRSPRDLSIQQWQRHPVTVDLAADPRYTGGAIGFALWRNSATTYCGTSRFSVREHNSRDLNNLPFVGALVYASKVEPGAFYLAFEDGPFPAADWRSTGTDGDYNDYVAYVSGCFNGSGPTGPAGNGGAGGTDPGPGAAGSSDAAGNGGAASDSSSRGGTSSKPHGASGASTDEAAGESSTAVSGGRGDEGDEGGAGQGAGGSGKTGATSKGCGCRIGGTTQSPSALLLAAAMATCALRRARRRAR